MALTNADLAKGSMWLQAAGVASSVVGTYYSAQSQVSALKHQAAMAESAARIQEINARIAEMGAESALLQGKKQVASITMAAGQLKSQQKVALSKSGVDMTVGSAREIQDSADLMKAIDVEQAQQNALQAAFGYKVQSMNALSAAASSRIDATMARGMAKGIDTFGSTAMSLIGGAGQVAGSWYAMNKAGAFTDTTPVFGGGGGGGGAAKLDKSGFSAPQSSAASLPATPTILDRASGFYNLAGVQAQGASPSGATLENTFIADLNIYPWG